MDIADRFSDREHVEKLADFLGTSVESVESTSRYDLVRRLFSDERIQLLEKLREKGKVVVSTFARNVEEKGEFPRRRGKDDAPVDPSAVLPPYSEVRSQPRVQETRIAEAIRDGVARVVGTGFGDREERVSGVLIVSDGQENSGSASAIDVARRFGERRTPVHTLGVGNPDEPKDVRLTHLDVNEVVLVDDVVPIDATVIADGYEGERVAVRLLVDSRLEQTTEMRLGPDGKAEIARLQYRPRTAGEVTISVEVEGRGGEVFDDNASLSKTIRVLDEKIRVLYVENLPRWEYRFLEHALIRDVTTETHVWLFSADEDFVQECSPSLQPLTALPMTREELFRYHVIILGDVDPELFAPGDWATFSSILKDFVDEGGGLVFLSGRHANPAKYVHTDLYAVLPVEVPETAAAQGGDFRPVTQSFKVRLTPEGKQLPLMRLDNDPERNVKLWEDETDAYYSGLPPFFWYAQVGREKPSAVVLARHPRDEDPIHRVGRVVFAYMSYGRGRTFFSAVDNTWRWRAGVDNLYFYRFWGQVARFVAAGRLLGQTPRFQVATDKTVYQLGETVRIDARVFDVNMKPSQERSVTLYHQVQGRENEPPEEVELTLNEVKGPGSYEGTISASVRGRHDVWLGAENQRAAFRSFSVEIPALETRDPRLNREFLSRVAHAGGGRYFELHQALEAVEALEGVTRRETGTVEGDALWDEWWVVLLFAGLITFEWILRKGVRLQ